MSPLVLALAWMGAGIAAGLALPRRLRARFGWLAPAAAAGLAAVTARVPRSPGPAASATYGATLALGRPAAGLAVAAGASLALALLLAPRLDGGEVLAACTVGAAAVVVLTATVPVVWGLGVAVAAGALVVRWVTTSPGRVTLTAGRVATLGAAVLVGGAAFVPPQGPAVDTRSALAGGMLAGGLTAELALVPLGGWAVAAAERLRGIDLAPWALLLAPAMLFSAAATSADLPLGARIPFDNVLLDLGLISAVFGAVQAVRSPTSGRYVRILLSDIALAAAGIGTSHGQGTVGAYALVLTHLAAAPLLIHGPRPGLEQPRRLAFLALSGFPPTPAFWGRFLVLEACRLTAVDAFTAALLTAALIFVASLMAIAEATARRPARVAVAAGAASAVAATPRVRALAWVVALSLAVSGLVPALVLHTVFGTS